MTESKHAAETRTTTLESPSFLRGVFIEGGRFWERGRLAYNGVQLLLTAVMAVLRWPKAHFFVDNFGSYIAFAFVANILYTAVYLPEALLQIPQLRPFTRAVRWCVFIIGTAYACVLAGLALDTVIFSDPIVD
jgi:hypothetical protein